MKKYVSLMLVVLLVLTGFILAQDKKKDQQPQAQAAPQAQEKAPATPEQKAQEEMTLVKRIQDNVNNPQEQAAAAEEFIQKFPNSQNIMFVRFQAFMAYQRLNNFEKMEENGKIVMQAIPDNPVIPTLLAYAYAENKKVAEAEDLAAKAMAILDKMVKPENVPAEQWDPQINSLKCTLYSSMGYVDLQKVSKIDKADKAKREEVLNKAIGEFNKATALDKLDDISYYRLGICYALENKVDESLSSYAKAAAINRTVGERAKTDIDKILETLKKNNQLGDMTYEGLIAKAKQELGIQ
jgi:tetratricopeptide (TPR) repeat protein